MGVLIIGLGVLIISRLDYLLMGVSISSGGEIIAMALTTACSAPMGMAGTLIAKNLIAF